MQSESKDSTIEKSPIKPAGNSKEFEMEMENSNIRINSEETSPFKLQDRTGGRSNYLVGQAQKESLLKEKFLRLLLPESEGANEPTVPSALQAQLIGRLFSPS